jgi:hypothetical protein
LRVSVFDAWNFFVPPFSYICRPICPFASDETELELAIVAAEPRDGVQISFAGDETPIPLTRDGAWIFRRVVPRRPLDLQFAVGVPGPRGAANWKGDAAFRLWSSDADALSSRFVWGSPFCRSIGAYVPLASLRGSADDCVGDFATLVEFARWAKTCGLQHVHVHIETIHGHLIDPVHATVQCEPREHRLHSIREAKLVSLTRAYGRCRSRCDTVLSRLLDEFPWVRPAASGDFGCWVQCTLFEQLANAYQQILGPGVQLMVDFVGDGPFALFPRKLAAFGRFAHMVRIVQPINLLFQPVPIDEARRIFGALADVILATFCICQATAAMPRFECVDRQWTAEQLEMVAQKTQVSKSVLVTQMNELLDKACDPCRHVLQLLAMDTPAAVLLDETLTNWFGPKNIWETFHMVPSGSLPIAEKTPSIAIPRRLSPEMLSEFSADCTQDEIR